MRRNIFVPEDGFPGLLLAASPAPPAPTARAAHFASQARANDPFQFFPL